jgi:hypothetical protein
MKEIFEKALEKFDAMKVIVGLVMLTVFVLVSWKVITSDLPAGNKEIAVNLVGIVEGLMISIVQYYFGSSKGSADKNEMLKNGKP